MKQLRPPRQRPVSVYVLLVAGALASAVEAGTQLFTPPSRETVILQLDPRGQPGRAVETRDGDRSWTLQQADRLQYQHRFAEAESLLTRWLAAAPLDTDALLQRAQLRVAQNNPRGALGDCLRASPRLDSLAASACQAQAQGALGQISAARQLIEAALARSRSSTAIESWAQGLAAELAARDGAIGDAERWHRAALANAGGAHYPRVAYAEFLISQRRRSDALQLLASAPDSSTVMRLRRRALDLTP